MRILMLGWEFPPFIAGGLGTACYGLTRALDRLGHEVIFVLPKPVDRSHASHIRLLSPDTLPAFRIGVQGGAIVGGGGGAGGLTGGGGRGAGGGMGGTTSWSATYTMPGFEHTTFRTIPAGLSSPYGEFAQEGERADSESDHVHGHSVETDGPDPAHEEFSPDTGAVGAFAPAAPPPLAAGWGSLTAGGGGGAGAAYQGDMFVEGERYARLAVALCRGERFDAIHAHDWLTFPAGLALARISRKPLVVHVHSTEFDRSGEHVNQRVYDIERRGMHGASRVIAVSELTKSMCVGKYGVDPARVDVVYNGIENEAAQPTAEDRVEASDKIVLFLGRITMQKGPEYFVRAAARVLEKVPNVKFVVAGSGDMAVSMIEEAAALGIGHRVLFTGFLRGGQVDQVFRMADCYVMPSVSEPFGIAPLEAMRNDVPTIISKQSGVSEVLTHVLKVDFWDIDEMANMIVAVLRHPPLAETMRTHGSLELRKLTWEGAAKRCVEVYGTAIAAQPRRGKIGAEARRSSPA